MSLSLRVKRSNPEPLAPVLDCRAEPVLGLAFGQTRGLAMTNQAAAIAGSSKVTDTEKMIAAMRIAS